MDKYQKLFNYCKELGVEAKYDVPLSSLTSFKIGGNCRVYAEAENSSHVSGIVRFCRQNEIKYIVIGKGSNIIANDKELDMLVIRLTGELAKVTRLDNTTLHCAAGLSLAGLCREAENNGLSGLEFAWGIPGSVGGAVYMNAGAYGGEIKDTVYSVTHIDNEGKIGTIKSDDLNFAYRHSVYKENGFTIIGATFKLKLDNKTEIRNRMDDYMSRRKDKQPLEYPSAGSVFRRPEGNYAGALIEKCGLKGKTVGGAQVSPKHAGFIVNIGGATADDVKSLIKLIQTTVKKETGYDLQREVIYLD